MKSVILPLEGAWCSSIALGVQVDLWSQMLTLRKMKANSSSELSVRILSATSLQMTTNMLSIVAGTHSFISELSFKIEHFTVLFSLPVTLCLGLMKLYKAQDLLHTRTTSLPILCGMTVLPLELPFSVRGYISQIRLAYLQSYTKWTFSLERRLKIF